MKIPFGIAPLRPPEFPPFHPNINPACSTHDFLTDGTIFPEYRVREFILRTEPVAKKCSGQSGTPGMAFWRQ